MSSLELIGRVTVMHDHGDEAGFGALELYCAPGVTQVIGSGVLDPTSDCSQNRHRSVSALQPQLANDWAGSNNGVPYERDKGLLASAQATYTGDKFNITSTSGYYRLDNIGFGAFTYTRTGQIYSATGENGHYYSEELRLNSAFEGPVNFTAGAYYDKFDRGYFGRTMIFYAGPDIATGRNYDFDNESQIDGHSTSAFGQVRWTLANNVELAGGARWTHEDKATDQRNAYVHYILPLAAPGLALPAGQAIDGDFSDHNISPEATLTWHPDERMTLYAAYKTGFKSGGFSISGLLGSALTADDLRLRSEKAQGEEIGFKAELLDRSLRVDVTAFRYDYKDLQVTAFDATTLSYITKNAAKARTQGVETSALYRATRELTLRSSIAYDRARYLSFPGAQCGTLQTAAEGCIDARQDLSGAPLVRAPEWTGNIGGSYELPFVRGSQLAFNADAFFTTGYHTQVNEDPATHQGGFWRLNAGCTVSAAHDHLELSLIGKNLTNKIYRSYSNDNPGGLSGTYQSQPELPRQIVLQGTARF
jgi:outer membrane receptor protein involved in Fe transport